MFCALKIGERLKFSKMNENNYVVNFCVLKIGDRLKFSKKK